MVQVLPTRDSAVRYAFSNFVLGSLKQSLQPPVFEVTPMALVVATLQ